MQDTLFLDDTIAALASAAGAGERGILRISGSDTRLMVSRVFQPDDPARWQAVRGPWRHPGRVTLPGFHLPLKADVLFWPTHRSYTGEPLAEIHTISSPPLLEALLALLYTNGARPANRGEFTLRAFRTGRIDLLQAEAVLGVIDATDQQQLQLALSQLGGGLSSRIAALHEELLLHLADLEAGLDFVEEGIEFVSRDLLQERLQAGLSWLQELQAQSTTRWHSTTRRRVVLAGLPNAGKSTLFNALCGEAHALVSSQAGTTRDYLTAALDWSGLPIELVDTAGWMNTTSGIDDASGRLRQEQFDRADLIVWCTSATLAGAERSVDDALQRDATRQGVPQFHILTKGDCQPVDAESGRNEERRLMVSALDGSGLDELRLAVVCRLQNAPASGQLLGSTFARCQESLRGGLLALSSALEAADTGAGDELIAIELREAIDSLGKIVGRVYTDDVLDRIFSRFCIGK